MAEKYLSLLIATMHQSATHGIAAALSVDSPVDNSAIQRTPLSARPSFPLVTGQLTTI